ncbi:MAG: hypothetical protein IPK55_10840 [Streptococcus sp.]|nr:hypothetical protein [Streptococcus sp.]
MGRQTRSSNCFRELYFRQLKYDTASIFTEYFKGERERIQSELENPYTYYSKYDSIKDQFHLFGFLSDELKTGDPNSKEFKTKFRQEISKYFDTKIEQFKQDVFNQTGLPLNQNHPILNVVQVQKKIKELGFDNFLRAYVINRTIYEIEHFIISGGELVGHMTNPTKGLVLTSLQVFQLSLVLH